MEVALNIESYWVMTYTKMSTGVNVSGSGRRRPWCNQGSERSLQHQPGPQCINKNREDHKPLMLHICVLHLYLKQHVSLKCQTLSSKAHGTSVTQPLTANINVVWFKWSFFVVFFWFLDRIWIPLVAWMWEIPCTYSSMPLSNYCATRTHTLILSM